MDLDRSPSFPLLAKDLLEQSMQRKTYAYRAVFAVALYSGGLWIYQSMLKNGTMSLGLGADVLTKLVWLQAAVTFAIVPLIACGSLAGEKERNTLELLILTKLSLRGIVVEKFCALLVSVGILQFLALPLLALTYPMGGVEAAAVMAAFIGLACAAAIALAWAIFCSCWAYTTYGAIWAYLAPAPLALLATIPHGPAQQILLPVIALYGCAIFIVGMINGAHVLEAMNGQKNVKDPDSDIHESPKTLPTATPAHVVFRITAMQMSVWAAGVVVAAFPKLLLSVVLVSITVVILSILVIAGPSILKVRRQAPTGRVPSQALAAVDVAVREVNDLGLRGLEFHSTSTLLPVDKPLAWLELRHLGFRWRTLIWSGVAVQFVLAMMLIYGLDLTSRDEFSIVWLVLESLMWGVSLIAIVAYATGLFQARTLEIVLTTPLSATEIVQQRMSGIQRAIVVWSLPLATMWLARVSWLHPSHSRLATEGLSNLWLTNGIGLIAIIVFPSFAAWLGVFAGMQGNRVRGLLTATGVVAALCVIPWLATWLGRSRWLWGFPMTPLSPVEVSAGHSGHSTFGLLLSIALTYVALLTLRFAAHRQFHRQFRLEPAEGQ